MPTRLTRLARPKGAARPFLLWAAYQLFPTLPHGALLNDGAIALFAFDAAMIVIGESGELLQVRVDRTSPTNWQFPPD